MSNVSLAIVPLLIFNYFFFVIEGFILVHKKEKKRSKTMNQYLEEDRKAMQFVQLQHK